MHLVHFALVIPWQCSPGLILSLTTSMVLCGLSALAGGWALQIGAEWQSVLTGDAISRGELFSDDYPALLATQFVWGSVLGGDSFNEYYGALFFANASNSALRIYTASLAAHRLSWGRKHERCFSAENRR